jgi:hypothetical protein
MNNKPSGSINCGEILHQLRTCYPLRKVSARRRGSSDGENTTYKVSLHCARCEVLTALLLKMSTSWGRLGCGVVRRVITDVSKDRVAFTFKACSIPFETSETALLESQPYNPEWT